MILADSSAWIEYDRGTDSPVHRRLLHLVDRGGPLAVTEPVIMEVLAGASAPHAVRWRRLFSRFELLSFRSPTDFDAATTIYRRCRERGITPRGLLDCTIAAVAWRTGASLLAADADLTRIAEVMGIDLD